MSLNGAMMRCESGCMASGNQSMQVLKKVFSERKKREKLVPLQYIIEVDTRRKFEPRLRAERKQNT